MLRTIFVLGIALVGFRYAMKSAFYALLLYLWVAYFRPEQWVWHTDLIAALNLSLLSGLFVVISAFASGTRWPGNLRTTLLGLFLAQSLMSMLFAVDVGYAWPFWFEFLKTVTIAYMIVALTTDADRLRLVLCAMALSLGLEGAKQGWAELILHPGSPNMHDSPMLGDNNGVAVGMLMLVPIFTVLASTARTRYERLFHRFMAFGVLYRGISTYSRGGFLAAGALALFYILRSRRRIPALAGVVIAAILVLPVLPDRFWQRMSTIRAPQQHEENLNGDETSALGRLHFWSVAVDMAADRPIFGVGHNSYNRAYDRYDDMKGAFGKGRSVHSAWFGLLAELGYPGLFLFLAMLALAFGACWRARAVSRLGPEHAMLGQLAFAIEGGLIVFAVGGTFLPFQYTEMLWHALALSIALDIIARGAQAAVATRDRRPGFGGTDPIVMAAAS